jgi:SAM-dependent methyltransferase
VCPNWFEYSSSNQFASDPNSMAPALSPGAMLINTGSCFWATDGQNVAMESNDGHEVSELWSRWRGETDLQEYFTRWQRLEASGQSSHGEADFIESLHPRSVLDAGCGMGRVAIELDRRGVDVVGVDLDDDLLEFARRSQPAIRWLRGDLATVALERRFDIVAMLGNVMVFCRPSDRPAIISNAVAHLEDAGQLVAGFELPSSRQHRSAEALTLDEYDRLCTANGLELVRRCSTWQGDPYSGEPYAVSAHRRKLVQSA